MQGCKEFLIPRGGWTTTFVKSVGEEYQVLKRVREYDGCGEEYNAEKKGKQKQYPLFYNIKAVGKIIN